MKSILKLFQQTKTSKFHYKLHDIYFRNEFFLADYIYKLGNYNTDFTSTALSTEGYTDWTMGDASTIKSGTSIQTIRNRAVHTDGGKTKIEFTLIPNIGFLANPDPLMKNCELKLCFDRADPKCALLALQPGGELGDLAIEDCYAVTEYISSPQLRSHFDRIENEPIQYNYEDVEVLIKSIPQGDTNIRFDNLRGGNIPSHIFAGIIKTDALNGSTDLCATKFGHHDVKEMNFTLNGNSVNGYPLNVNNSSPIVPFQKFLDSTMRINNISSAGFLSLNEFKFNWIWSHHFEAEESSQGWSGINFKLDEAYNEAMSLVIWIISPCALKLDRFHQVEKLNT